MAHMDDIGTAGFHPAQIHDRLDAGPQEGSNVFRAFDEFLDRMPAWIFHSLGAITCLIAMWFTLAFLGGLPGGIVEWIALAMVGAFAYAVGFMIPLVLTYLFQESTRLLVALTVIGGGALLSSLAFPLPA